MSNKSASKSKKTSRAGLDQPFDADILRRAREIASSYRILIEQDEEVGFLGRVVEMPMVMADGVSPQACFEQVREAATGAVALMMEMGDVPPAAASSKRTAQINVRVTEEERTRLEETARQLGFRGVSDFIRTTVLAKTA